MKNKKLGVIGAIIAGIVLLIFFLSLQFAAPQPNAQEEVFTVAPGTEQKVVERLAASGYIKTPWAFRTALFLKGKNEIKPGGYFISKNMDAWKLATIVTAQPQLKWVTIPEGLRKEEIGEKLATTLGWNEDELNKWNTVYTAMTFDYLEGVYFPDTYLIPTNENGLDVAKRMTNRFNEKFAPYIDQFAKQDIIWTTGIRLASIVQREAAGPDDMPLIAGILWNRLLKGQNLEVDATVQYARGKTDKGWWSPITPTDIQNINSPYNTYKNKGLPPHPISNPGITAIEAVLNPAETDCLYYLHDSNKQIHCAITLGEHQANIEKYLK